MHEVSAQRLYHSTLILLTLLAFALRAFHLDAQSLWYDEGVTAEIARRNLVELTRWTAQDIQPPLYYYVIAGWGRLAGWSEWSLRFPSVIFGALVAPLMAALALALSRRRTAGVLAALLAAAHPLLIYYSQEARMYAMLTLLVVGLVYYLLVCTNRTHTRPWQIWGLYVLLAAAAVYTHYFAFFLIGALGVVFLVDLIFNHRGHTGGQSQATAPGAPAAARHTGPGRRLLHFCLAHVALLLLYVPWLSAMLGQLASDASYWEGAFKLDEALRHIANRFTTGETMVEAQAIQWLLPFGVISLFAAVALLVSGFHQRRTFFIALLWLILPVAGILALAQIVPKFNARYAMIALPGLLLLWSGGLAQLLPSSDWQLASGLRFTVRPVRSAPGLLLVAVMLFAFSYANYNWFADAAYTKSEWRRVSSYIRERIAAKVAAGQPANDLVVLVSGHTWPVWNYYAPDMPALRLPDLEILDVNAVLDFASTALPLRNALHETADVWLVEWQDEIVDPMEIVPLQLQLAGQERRIREQFWQIQLAHYTDIQADAVLVEPTGISPESVNFGNQLYLLDHTVADNGDLLLFWRLHPNAVHPPPDLRITAQLFTDEGLPYHRMIDRRPAGFEYPVFRWRADQITLGRIPAAEWAGPGALPGQYRIRLGVYDIDGDLAGLDMLGENDQPLGKHALLDIALPYPTRGQANIDRIAFARIVDDLFLQLEIGTEQAEPGQAIAAEIHWYADAPPTREFDLQLRWRLRSTEQILGEQVVPITSLPAPSWPETQLMRSLQHWRPPLHLPPDDYWLEVGVTLTDSAYIRVPFRVLGSTRRYTPPAYTTAIDRVFDEDLHLLGVIEPLDFTPRAGGQVALTLVWQAIRQMPADYTTTVQWLGSDNRPAAQVDLPLPGGSSNWIADQVELQSVIVNVPEAPGTYRLVIAVYNSNQPEMPRLMTQLGEDLIELAQLTVVE